MAQEFGKGIVLASPMNLAAQNALDNRLVVATIADRDAHVTNKRAYEGMVVYVEAEKKNYQLIDGTWGEFGFTGEDFAAGIEDSLTSTATDKALSANKGKELKDITDKINADKTVEGSTDYKINEALTVTRL